MAVETGEAVEAAGAEVVGGGAGGDVETWREEVMQEPELGCTRAERRWAW